VLLRVYIPQLLPNLISAVRLSLGAGWLFLIAAEAIASTDGLGYRIFLVRRYMSMDIILPYVAWITLLAFVIDQLLALLSRKCFSWNHQEGSK
jgi:NitT/TauT family transport system permease protein